MDVVTGAAGQGAINSAAADGLFYGNPKQLGIQAIAVAASWAWAGIGTFVVLKITGIFVPLRVDEKQEEVGLDVSQHGEPAYGI